MPDIGQQRVCYVRSTLAHISQKARATYRYVSGDIALTLGM